MAMKAFILAGGFATRLWPITERRAKPLLPLAGKPLLSYLVEAIPKDIEITVSTNAVFGDDMKVWAKTMKGRNIKILIEDAGHEGQKLGALGAVAKWLTDEKIDEDVLLLAGDNYVGCSMETFLSMRRDCPLIAAHDIGDLALASQFGTVIVEHSPSPEKKDLPLSFSRSSGRECPEGTREAGGGARGEGRVTSFEEKPLHPKSTFVSTGWWWLPKICLSIVKDHAKEHPDNIGGVFEEFLRRKISVDCFVFSEIWKDIGTFESYLGLHKEIVGTNIVKDASAIVDEDSKLLGSMALGPKTKIEKSTLTDCILFGDSTIKDCVLTRCILDEECVLQGVDLTDQMLRASTVLERR